MFIITAITAIAAIAVIGVGVASGVIPADFLSAGAPSARTVASNESGIGKAPEVNLRPGKDTDIAATEATKKGNKAKQYGNWMVACPDGADNEPEKCSARLAVRDAKRNVTVVNWLVGYNKDSKLLMEITTPTDVLIAPGLQLSMEEGKVQRHPYLSCGPAGCLTRISPDAEMLKGLRKAETVKLGISTPAGKTIIFQITVNGIADGLNALAGL